MKFRTVVYTDWDKNPPEETIFQVLDTTCPLCKKPIRFALSLEDKRYKEEVEYWERQAKYWQNKFGTILNKVL